MVLRAKSSLASFSFSFATWNMLHRMFWPLQPSRLVHIKFSREIERPYAGGDVVVLAASNRLMIFSMPNDVNFQSPVAFTISCMFCLASKLSSKSMLWVESSCVCSQIPQSFPLASFLTCDVQSSWISQSLTQKKELSKEQSVVQQHGVETGTVLPPRYWLLTSPMR